MKNKDPKLTSPEENVIIVDRKNRPIDIVPRYIMRRDGLIHRATYILVFNDKKQVFTQKRTQRKDFLPGYYDVAAGGVVCEGENYHLSARRELQEELGIQAALKKLFDFYREVGNQKMWGRAYVCAHNGPFILQAEEIDSGEFNCVDDILQGKISPITPDTLYVLKRYREELVIGN
jgi:isopentenyldiphosphate isomerase